MLVPIKHALLSVTNKQGLTEFAAALAARGVQLYASGGTRKHLEQAGLNVIEVAAYTGFPEMLDGRVKTLHPKIHGGILARHNRPDDLASLKEQGIVTFELVVVNLYEFAKTIAKPGVTDDEAIENIDIGGPSLIRGAAKNHEFTAIVTKPDQYAGVLAELEQHGGTSIGVRRSLAGIAFQLTADYDRAIADYFAGMANFADDESWFLPPRISVELFRLKVLRYGENPHQQAALYAASDCPGGTIVAAQKLHGKELSYNNLLDADAALGMVRGFAEPSAVVIKHNNPCGAASSGSLATAMQRALDGDAVSAFGGIVGVNRPLDAATAEVLSGPDRFIEAVIAPSFEPAALEILTTKPKWKANVRLLAVGDIGPDSGAMDARPIAGGMLLQQADADADPETEWRVVTKVQPTAAQLAELRFAWAMVRHVKSNAIVLAKDRMLIGVGAGQMSRVDSTEIAIRKAGDRARGSVLASDAFFPFGDSIQLAAAAGIAAVIQPGGSKRDDDSIAECDAAGIAMIFTGRRHFRH